MCRVRARAKDRRAARAAAASVLPLSAGDVLLEAVMAWPDGVWRAVLMPGSWDAMCLLLGTIWERRGPGGARIGGFRPSVPIPTTDIRVA